ncbi:MAG: hypothetical protein ACM3S1_15100 [Hyphomicrobiales bacterium]
MRALLLAATLVAAFAFVACGDKDDDDTTPTTAATATTGGTGTSGATATNPDATSTASNADDGTPSSGGGSTDDVEIHANPEHHEGNITLADVRVGKHEAADRIVFEFEGDALPGAEVKYDDHATACGSGQNVTVGGEAMLVVEIDHAQAHDNQGATTAPTSVEGPGQTIVEAKSTCDFEGHVDYVIGTTGEKNFKVSTLQNPTRIVIDVLK